jgi:DNA polymerase III delta prime subunit
MTDFTPATRRAARLRLGLIGPAGSGKTYTALCLAHALGGRVALIDTEHGSASKYALPPGGTPGQDGFPFDVLELASFNPQTYIDALQAAQQAGYDTVIIDSLSHAWVGRDGALEMVDRAAARERGNSFAAWRTVTPLHNQLVDAMLACRCHLIATLRAKMEYVQERDERTGKTAVRKVGLQPVQRDGLEYEFDVIGDLDHQNVLTITKTRCPALNGAVIARPGASLAATLQTWLQGEPQVQPPAIGLSAGVLSPSGAAVAATSVVALGNGGREGAFDRYLAECATHRQRLGERLYAEVLAAQGLEQAEQIPAVQRLTRQGLLRQKGLLEALRRQPDLDSDEGFEGQLRQLGALCLDAGLLAELNQLLERYVATPLDADAAHVPVAQRRQLLDQIQRLVQADGVALAVPGARG